MSNYSTGSLDNKSLVKLFKSFADPLFGKSEPSSYQVISGSGLAWYYAPKDRSMIRVPRGTEIIILPVEPDEQKRLHAIDASGRYFLIPADEVLDVGLN
tara:strand:- start:82 stop:378 length:297 start_codon:yes stop_codon:yes gene_type:complete